MTISISITITTSYFVDLCYPFSVILTDSCSATRSIKDRLRDPWSTNIIHDIVRLILFVKSSRMLIRIACVPGQLSLKGNEIADCIVKSILGLPSYILQSLPWSDILTLCQRDLGYGCGVVL